MKASRRPLRVVHITWGLGVGGLEKLLVDFARHADRARFDLRFVSLGTRGELASAIEDCGWPVTALDQPEGLRPALVPLLARQLHGWKADIVHTHNTKALVYGGPAARLAGAARLIHTWHGQNLVGSPREGMLFRLLGRLPDHVVAVSRDAARLLVALGIPPTKVRTIWNGIDTRRFTFAGPQPLGPLVTVARLSPEKDVQTLLRAMALAHERQPALRLEIAGDGACRQELQHLSNELGLNGSVRFLGQVNEVPALLRRAGLFVLPSLTEGISLTLLEAAATGLPAVATNVGGNPEIIEQGKTGLLVPAAAPASLADAIVETYQDVDRRRKMGLAARQRIEAHFDVTNMVRTYECLYEDRWETTAPERSQPPPFRPRLIANMPKLAEQDGLVRCSILQDRTGGITTALRLWRAGFDRDAIVLDQDYRTLVWLCLLRILWPVSRPPLVSLDLVLARPGPSLASTAKGAVKKLVLTQVDLFLMHMKERQVLKRVYGIAPHKVRYIPFKVNFRDDIATQQPREGDYVFTGGRSRRDYTTFCAAMAGLDFPGLIVTPRAAENAEHGTSLGEVVLPKNVAILHDDGSMESWVGQIARCKLAVFCIAPETISPSGVGAYLLAMALGKCVIISDCPSTRDILIHEDTAILVPMRDPDSLREAIQRAWNDDAYRQRIAESGRQYALSLGGEEMLARNVALAVVDFLRRQREKR